jgi:nitrate/nitrite-specific signal transduction histidine kinase
MRYRAHMLGGELTIEPAAEGRGTRISCTLTQPDPEAVAAARTAGEQA